MWLRVPLSLPMARQLQTAEILQRNQPTRLAPPRRRDLCLMVWTQWVFSLSRSAFISRRDGRYLFGARLPACLSPKSGSAFRISLRTADYKTAQLRAARIASWMLSVKVAEDPESALRLAPPNRTFRRLPQLTRVTELEPPELTRAYCRRAPARPGPSLAVGGLERTDLLAE